MPSLETALRQTTAREIEPAVAEYVPYAVSHRDSRPTGSAKQNVRVCQRVSAVTHLPWYWPIAVADAGGAW